MTSLDKPWGFQKVEAPRFQDSLHMKVVRLSALHADHLYPQEIFLVLISVRGWVDSTLIAWPEGLRQWKIQNDTIGNRTLTFHLVAQCLKQLRHRVTLYKLYSDTKYVILDPTS